MGQSPSSDDCNKDGFGLPFLQGNAEFGTKHPHPRQFCNVSRKFANEGELLFSVRAPVGALNIADQKYGIGRGLCSISANDGVSSDFSYWLISVIKPELDSVSTGSTFEAVSAEQVGNVRIPMPPLIEQTKIAEFLDHETAKIDILIEKQQSLIDLLKEKRQAVISHAVTKGLNPDVPMKDSGVEWFGNVPENWTVTRIGLLCEFISYGFTNPMPTADDGPHMLTASDIDFQCVNFDGARRTTELAFNSLLTNKSKPKSGDVLITKDGTLGRVAVFDGRNRACISQSVALLRLNGRKIIPEFLSLALSGATYQSKMIFDAGGTTIKHIYITTLAKMEFALPSLNEQAEIIMFLSDRLNQIDSLIEFSESLSLFAMERRAALISAAVTGKIDVRDWKAPESDSAKIQ